MLDILQTISDIIVPPHPSIVTLRRATRDELIQHFSPHLVTGTFALSSYHTPLIHAAITANKFHNYQKAALLLANLFDHWLDTLPEQPTYIIPIPLGPTRLRTRGYNQVERIIQASRHNLSLDTSLLVRVRDTAPQTSLTREERFANIQDAFSLQQTNLSFLAECRLIICDDVITTGATLRAATTAITPHLPPDCELITVALAH